MGSGVINMIVDVIVSDLVPLRERDNFMAIILTVYFTRTALGLFVGGAIIDTTIWRWVRTGRDVPFIPSLEYGTKCMLLDFGFFFSIYLCEYYRTYQKVRSNRGTGRRSVVAMIFAFLRIKSNKEMTFLQKLKRIDYVGNIMLIASTVAI